MSKHESIQLENMIQAKRLDTSPDKLGDVVSENSPLGGAYGQIQSPKQPEDEAPIPSIPSDLEIPATWSRRSLN